MARRHAPTPEFPVHLRALYDRFPLERSLAADPLSCVRPFAGSRRTAETAGIVAATLAVGNTTAIRGAFARLLERAGGDLDAWVERAGGPAGRSGPFQHRWIRADQMDYLAGRLRAAYAAHGSLEAIYLDGRERLGGCAGGLDALARALRSPGPSAPAPPGYDRLFPSPLDPGASPCKRLALFLRWMVRREYPDLGLWTQVDPAELCVPLDQHVFWIAYHLGLTARRTRSWTTATEVTDALRAIDPVDPVRFDFVLCHTGISGDCPKRRDERVCGPCAVRPDCLLWRGARRAG
jgi:uncharacterized protein (TIGR02757 family)